MSFLGIEAQEWIELGIGLGILLFVGVVGRWVVNLLLKRLAPKLTGRTATTIDDRIIEALRVPLYAFLLTFTFDSVVSTLSAIPDGWQSTINDIVFVFYFLAGFILTWRVVSALFGWYSSEMVNRAENAQLVKGLVGFFDTMALIVIALIGLIVLLSRFEINVTGIVATLGVGSLAVALAAKDVFDDTISGLLIILDQPCRVGDRIQIQALNTWGDVVDIGLRSTRIRTRDNRMVIVPNATLGSSLIVNYAYPNNEYRIQVQVGIAYGSDIEHARKTLVEAVKTVEGVLTNQLTEALFLEFGDSALQFRVRWWIESYVDTRRMFDKVNTAIYNALMREGIEMPFPQRDIWHRVSAKDAEALRQIIRE